MLSRATNPLIPELFTYVRARGKRHISLTCADGMPQRNKEGRLIVIYDDDEKIAAPMANLFFEKGFDNVFVLSKGLSSVSTIFSLSLTLTRSAPLCAQDRGPHGRCAAAAAAVAAHPPPGPALGPADAVVRALRPQPRLRRARPLSLSVSV
jgi:hypothetical protein